MSDTPTIDRLHPASQSAQSDSVQGLPSLGAALPESSSGTKMTVDATAAVSSALNDWVAGMSGPQDPPFHLRANFPDSEWGRFFRIFAVSTALAGTVAIARNIAPNLLAPVLPDGRSLGVLTIFTCFGVIYSLYSRLFGITITIRQSLFCFALIVTPWFPLYVLLKATGSNLGIVWFLLMPGLAVYVFFLTARAIHIVSGAHMVRVTLSLLLAVVLAVIAAITRVITSLPSSNPSH